MPVRRRARHGLQKTRNDQYRRDQQQRNVAGVGGADRRTRLMYTQRLHHHGSSRTGGIREEGANPPVVNYMVSAGINIGGTPALRSAGPRAGGFGFFQRVPGLTN